MENRNSGASNIFSPPLMVEDSYNDGTNMSQAKGLNPISPYPVMI